jgi:hypothetical protein
MTEDEQITKIIRASAAGQWLIGGSVDSNGAVTWAKCQCPNHEIHRVETAWGTESTVATVAQDLIAQMLSTCASRKH